MKHYKQGVFTPRNKQKYKGDASRIRYMSGWELKLMIYLDQHPDILVWSSEEFAISYRHPIEGTVRRYFPDMWFKKRDKDGTISTILVEVKPLAETRPPQILSGKKAQSKGYLYKATTWAVNCAKWEAAKKLCDAKGWQFMILTEKDLGIK